MHQDIRYPFLGDASRMIGTACIGDAVGTRCVFSAAP